jgi:hypothetical protein
MRKPNEFVEVFLSLVKWFLIVLLLNNAIWGIIFYRTVASSFEQTELVQDGENNLQGINNGTIN